MGSATPKSKALVPSRVSGISFLSQWPCSASGVREASGSDGVNGVMFYLKVSCHGRKTVITGAEDSSGAAPLLGDIQ